MKTSNHNNSKNSLWVSKSLSKTFFILITLLAFVISSCSSSDDENDDNGGGDVPVVDDSGILENLRITNLDSNTFPWNSAQSLTNECSLISLTNGKTKRWDIEGQGLIPVKINNLSSVPQALDLIEENLGMPLFDRTSIANTPDEDITQGIVFGAEEEVGSYSYLFNNSSGCGNVSFKATTEYLSQDFELEYDVDGNIVGYDYPVLGQAYDVNGTAVGNVLDGSPYIFDNNNVVVGILAQESQLLYDINGKAICTSLSGSPLFDANETAIGTTVEGSEDGFFSLDSQKNYGYYDASGRINGVILVRLDTMQCEFSSDEDEIEMIVNKLGYALGMGTNFDGFGSFNASGNFDINANFWNVLNTLYHNPIGSDEDSVVIYKLN
ncbi:hypothetical protein [Psychroflexus sp. MBR-150]|jgi:hypothetical protein